MQKFQNILRVTLVLSFVVGVSACGAPPKLGGAEGLTVRDAKELPAPTSSDMTAKEVPYLIGPFDKLMISVFGIEDLKSLEVQVDASGRISFPLAGVVTVSGKTPAETETALKERLRQAYIRDPQVTVNLKETLSQMVTVEGQVQKPGLYPVLGHMTLLRAIATAQGSTEFTRVDDIVIMRKVNGQQFAALYNLDMIRHGKYADPAVYANDIVMVGDNHARRLFKDYLQVFGLMASPIVITLNSVLK